MAYWQNSGITSIFTGTNANDGTGDNIRTGFIKVDNNFANLSAYIGGTQVDFLNSNIATLLVTTANVNTLNVNTANFTQGISLTGNINTGNLISSYGVYSSRATTGTLIATTASVSSSINALGGISTGASIVPTANVSYDLGSPTNYFRNVYSQGLIQVNTITVQSAASIYELQANVLVGSQQDIGILGKYNLGVSGASGNNYSFFGWQNQSNSFVFLSGITSDPTAGNSIVVGGTYGNVHFGSQLISNATSATSTTTGALQVVGGVGVKGNVYASTHYGNIVSTVATIGNVTVGNVVGNTTVVGNVILNNGNVIISGSPVVTAATLQNYATIYGGATITGITGFLSSAPSTSSSTGAVVIPNGGLGVGGNVVAGGFVGPYYGTIANPNQTNITTVGTLGNVTVGGTTYTTSVQATNVSTNNLVGVGNIFLTSVSGLTSLQFSDNSQLKTAKWTLVESFSSITTGYVYPTHTLSYYDNIYNELLIKFVNGSAGITTTVIPLPVGGGTWIIGAVGGGSPTIAFGVDDNSSSWSIGTVQTTNVYVYAR